MSRRKRKIVANKKYKQLLDKKSHAIIQVGIDLAIAITKHVANNIPFMIPVLREVARVQQGVILSQPLSMTKPDKYGKYKDYSLDGVVVGVNQ